MRTVTVSISDRAPGSLTVTPERCVSNPSGPTPTGFSTGGQNRAVLDPHPCPVRAPGPRPGNREARPGQAGVSHPLSATAAWQCSPGTMKVARLISTARPGATASSRKDGPVPAVKDESEIPKVPGSPFAQTSSTVGTQAPRRHVRHISPGSRQPTGPRPNGCLQRGRDVVQ